jgi:hypothetical protein
MTEETKKYGPDDITVTSADLGAALMENLLELAAAERLLEEHGDRLSQESRIELKHAVKRYPSQAWPAVGDLRNAGSDLREALQVARKELPEPASRQ